MVQDINVKYFFECFLDILNSRVTKFKHFSRINEDNMIVLLVLMTRFKVRLVVTKLMLPDQVTRLQ